MVSSSKMVVCIYTIDIENQLNKYLIFLTVLIQAIHSKLCSSFQDIQEDPMKKIVLILVFALLQIVPNQGQEWVQKIGIEAASKLTSILHDDNHTNIVLLENHQSSDTVIYMTSNIVFETTAMTLRYLPIR